MTAEGMYVDLYTLTEDDRIKVIGETAMAGKIVGFVVEDASDKADRYLGKLTEKFPGIAVYSRTPGPVRGTTMIKVGPPRQSRN